MFNEMVFVAQSLFISAGALLSLYIGKEALITFIALQSILANLFITKQITLFDLEAICSDAFTIGAILGLNLLQEYYGKQATQKAIWISLSALIFYTVVTQIHLAYIPNAYDTAHQLFYGLLHAMPRITIASLTVSYIVQQCDAWLYGFLKSAWPKHLLARTYVSIALCQLLDTTLFTYLALYGIAHNLLHIILISYAIKLASLALAGPWITLSRRLSITHS